MKIPLQGKLFSQSLLFCQATHLSEEERSVLTSIFDLIAARIIFCFLLVPNLSESEGRNRPARGKGKRAPVGLLRREGKSRVIGWDVEGQAQFLLWMLLAHSGSPSPPSPP